MRPLYLFLISLITISCSYINPEKERKKQVEKYSAFLRKNKADFEKLTSDIVKDKYVRSRIGYFIPTNELNSNLKSRLSELDISRISVSNMRCDSLEVQYFTNWIEYPTGQMYLVKDYCNSKQSDEGFYRQDNFIEVWGLGDGWVLWIDSDFI